MAGRKDGHISTSMKTLAYWIFLRPLILRNYAKRMRGEAPDAWFWADRLACDWGFFTKWP